MRPNRKKRELANWLRRRLGSPVIDVLIDTTQMDDCIDLAVDYFGEHAGGIGHEESLLVICPELLRYDATGSVCQPKPKIGRWRTATSQAEDCNIDCEEVDPDDLDCLFDVCTNNPPTTAAPTTAQCTTSAPSTSAPTSGCDANLDCDTIPIINTTHPSEQYGGPDGNPCTDFILDPRCCPKDKKGPGPGWCGDGIQDPHCFTETEKGDPDLIGPYWVEGDTTVAPDINHIEADQLTRNGFVWKTVYDIPKDVVGIVEHLPQGRGLAFGGDGFSTVGEALFSPIHMFLNNGGLGLGTGGRFGGGFVDLVGLELGLQYIEMFRTMYSVKMDAQLLDLQHQVRLSPAPRHKGLIALWVYRKVADQYMYEHIWVRQYAEALCTMQVGMNAIKYTGASFPGGANINAQFYIDKGQEMKQKLEDEIDNGKYSEPPTFFWG